MRIVIAIISAIVLATLSAQVYFVLRERNQFKTEITNLNDKLQALAKENIDLKSDIKYFSYPENLEKELRAKFNYKKPDEKLIIITP